MFLSRKIDIKLCLIYAKIHTYAILYNSCENPRIIFVLFYDVHKENMFTINLEEASKYRFLYSFDTILYPFLESRD